MRWGVLVLAALAGCNAIFGLSPTQLGGDGGDDAVLDGGSPDAAPRDHLGVVGAENYHFVANSGAGPVVDKYTLGADIGNLSPVCTAEPLSAGCSLVQCTDVSDPAPWPDAGTIFFNGMIVSALVPMNDGSYGSTTGTQRLFSDGSAVTIQADGAEVPAFEHTMNAPVTVVVDQDLPNDAHNVTLLRADGLSLTWSSGIAGTTVVVAMTAQNGGDTLFCQFPAVDGGGIIPDDALGALPAGDASFAAATRVIDVITAGDYRLELMLQGGVLDVTGDLTFGTITLQ